MAKTTVYHYELLDALSDGDYHSPTEIGKKVGWLFGCHWHSSWASPKLKTLEASGEVEADWRRWYRLTNMGKKRIAVMNGAELPEAGPEEDGDE